MIAAAFASLLHCERQSIDLLPVGQAGATAPNSPSTAGAAGGGSKGDGTPPIGDGGPEGNDCLPGSDCFDDIDCPPNLAYCEPCEEDWQCRGGLSRCAAPFRPYCVECLDNDDCDDPFGERCDALASRCLPRCTEDADCPSDRPRCENLTRRVCVVCTDNLDCQAIEPDGSLHCAAGECVECSTDFNCSPPTGYCRNFRCRECRHDAHCPDGDRCDDRSGSCVGDI